MVIVVMETRRAILVMLTKIDPPALSSTAETIVAIVLFQHCVFQCLFLF